MGQINVYKSKSLISEKRYRAIYDEFNKIGLALRDGSDDNFFVQDNNGSYHVQMGIHPWNREKEEDVKHLELIVEFVGDKVPDKVMEIVTKHKLEYEKAPYVSSRQQGYRGIQGYRGDNKIYPDTYDDSLD